MAYASVDEVREYCELTEDECPDEKVEEALAYAKGLIDGYCHTTFEEPEEDAEYLYDGNGTSALFAPDKDGPFAAIKKIEYYGGDKWVEYTGNYWLKQGGEWIDLETNTTPGNLNWRVTGRCCTQLDDDRQAMLKRAALGICKLYLVARDEPLGPSISSISHEGVSYTYQPLNEGHPTGVNWIDYILRSLRRSVVSP